MMGKLMLSADGDIMLYEVSKQILDQFDDLLEQFFDWKETNCYTEQLFVKFLQNRCGNESIKFVKNLGCFPADKIPEEYANIKWFNF